MNKYFVTFEQALALKQLGFDEPCLAQYRVKDKKFIEAYLRDNITCCPFNFNVQNSPWISAPLYSQAFEWFRSNHLLETTINRSWSMRSSYHYVIINNMDYDNIIQQESTSNRTYQQAESACLDELIKIVKQC